MIDAGTLHDSASAYITHHCSSNTILMYNMQVTASDHLLHASDIVVIKIKNIITTVLFLKYLEIKLVNSENFYYFDVNFNLD